MMGKRVSMTVVWAMTICFLVLTGQVSSQDAKKESGTPEIKTEAPKKEAQPAKPDLPKPEVQPVKSEEAKKESPAVPDDAPEAIKKDPRKQTRLGKYVTAKEAYEKWLANPEQVAIIDCRTPEEYIFVGHAPMAYNIPKQFVTHKYDAEKKQPVMTDNPGYVDHIKARFKPTDILMVMCRSGHRSSASVNLLAENGFTEVYNITDGFEGDVLKDSLSYLNGKRVINGWKNSGAPWTYELDPKRMYLPEEK